MQATLPYEQLFTFLRTMDRIDGINIHYLLKNIRKLFGYDYIILHINDYFDRQGYTYYLNCDKIQIETCYMANIELKDNVIFTESVYFNNQFYDDYINENGLHDTYTLNKEISLHKEIVLHFYKGKNESPFSPIEKKLCNEIASITFNHLKRAYTLQKYKYKHRMMLHSIYNMPIGIIIFDQDLFIYHYNDSALQYVNKIESQMKAGAFKVLALFLRKYIKEKELPINDEVAYFKNEQFVYKIKRTDYKTELFGYKTNYTLYFQPQEVKRRQDIFEICIEIGLSNREAEITYYISKGLSNQQIADRLYVSINTVKTHVKNIFNKLEVNNRIALINMIKQDEAKLIK